MADILIRDVDETVVKVLSQKAKKADMSREKYILTHLNRLAMVDVYREEREEYATLVKNMGAIIGNNTDHLKKVIELLEEIADKKEG